MAKKIGVVAGCLAVMFFGTAHAQENSYFGARGVVNLPDLSVSGYDFEESSGVNINFGYRINKNIAIEGNIDKNTFKHDGPAWDARQSAHLNPTRYANQANPSNDLTTITFDVKYSPDIRSSKFQPYFLAGVGLMISDPDEYTNSMAWDTALDTTIHEEDYIFEADNGDYSQHQEAVAKLANNSLCGELGVGFDFYMLDNLSWVVDVKYVMGMGDLEDISFLRSSTGFAYHFNAL